MLECPQCGDDLYADGDLDGNRILACTNCDYGHTDAMVRGEEDCTEEEDDEEELDGETRRNMKAPGNV